MEKTIVIFHSPCADGFTSAWIARKKYPDAEFFPTAHHTAPPDVRDKNVLILDFAYPRETLLKMLDDAASLTVLDHHKTNQKDLAGLVFCKFDMTRSGAGITWDELFPLAQGNYRPWLVDYVQDRDLWHWRLPFSREVSAALDSYPQDFETWDRISAKSPEDLAAEGAPLIRYQNQIIDRLTVDAREVLFEGHRVPVVNSPLLMSDIGSRLAQGKPFAVVWRHTSDGRYAYSLRSTDAGVDVSEIAKKHGGGGHRNAAGFESCNLLF
jgi:hypothetical protein